MHKFSLLYSLVVYFGNTNLKLQYTLSVYIFFFTFNLGSINVFLCFIFPIVIYLKLYPETPLKSKLLMGAVALLAIIGGIASTVSNAWNLSKEFHKMYFAEGATGQPGI